MRFRALSKNILVKPIPLAPHTTASGIELVSAEKTNDELECRGRVVSICPSCTNDHGYGEICPVRVGEVIVFRKYTGIVVRLDGEEYLAMTWGDAIGVIEE